MKILLKLIILWAASITGLLLSARLIPGVTLTTDPLRLLIIGGFLTILFVFVRPILKFVSAPFILITLGFFTLVINAMLLFLLDFFSKDITMTGLKALVLTTILVTATHAVGRLISRF